MHRPSLRKRLADGERTTGIWMMSGCVPFAEMVREAGLDFVVIDLEHGLFTLDTLPDVLRAFRGGITTPIVRVPNHDPSMVARVLDRGAGGVMVPRVPDAETAARVADAARFPPYGERGLAIPALLASAYGNEAVYRERADADTLVIVQVEDRGAVEEIDAISAVEGVDMVFIGPADLSANLGLEGEAKQAELLALLSQAMRRLRDAGMNIGMVGSPKFAASWLQDHDVQLIISGSDIGIMNLGIAGWKEEQTFGQEGY